MDPPIETRPSRRAFAVIFLLLLAGHLALIATARILPYQDLPTHLATATIYRHYGESDNRFDHYYELRQPAPAPNVLHRAFCSAPILPGVEAANKVYYIAYVLALPLLLLLVVRRIGGEPWYALLGFLLLYNYNVSWGFVGFTMGVPLVLLLVYLLARSDEGRGFALMTAALLAGLFFVHVLIALFGLLVLGVFTALRWDGRPSRALVAAAVAAPASALVAFWWLGRGDDGGPGLLSYLAQYYRWTYAGTLSARWSFLVHDNYHLYGGATGYAVAAALALFIVVVCLAALRRAGPVLADRAAWRRHAPLAALAIAGTVCTFGLPNNIPGQWSLWSRFPVFILLGGILVGSLGRPSGGRVLRVALVAAAVVHLAMWTEFHAAFRRENEGLVPEVFPDGSRGLVMSDLVSDMGYRGRPTYSHFADYYIVWKKGIGTTAAIEYRFGTVRRKVGYDELPRNNPYHGMGRYYRGRYENVDLVLVRCGVPDFYTEELAPFRHVWEDGDWSLLARPEALGGEPGGGGDVAEEMSGTSGR